MKISLSVTTKRMRRLSPALQGPLGLVVACLALVPVPAPASAQGVSTGGVRVAAGVDMDGRHVYAGQLEFSDIAGWNSVEFAISGFTEVWRSEESSQAGALDRVSEQTRLRGVALVSNWLVNRSTRGIAPYLLFGVGLGPIWLNWVRTASDVSGQRPSESAGQNGVMLGTLLNTGVGLGFGRHMDLRAQFTTVVVPPTDGRDGLTYIPTLTLATGIGIP